MIKFLIFALFLQKNIKKLFSCRQTLLINFVIHLLLAAC